MKAETGPPCDCCDEFTTVARICIVSEHGELVDYADLCRDCLLDAATSAGLSVSERIKQATPIKVEKPYD